jgi:hypothetical protein
MAFMFVTTLTASWELFIMFIQKATAQGLSGGDILSFRIDAFLVLLMAALAVISLADMAYKWYTIFSFKQDNPVPEPE